MKIKYFILLILIIFFSCDDQGGPSYGCTDIDACNYDSNAELEGGTCVYPLSNPSEGEYCDCNGESEPQIVGCDDVCGSGLEYDDCGVCGGDGSPDEFDCSGNCTADLDCAGECDGNAFVDCYGVCFPEYTYTYSDVFLKMQSLGCIGCHTGTSNGGLDLSTYSGIMSQTTNSGGVIDTDCLNHLNSIILQKIDGGSMSQYADQQLIDLITIWISQGAQE